MLFVRMLHKIVKYVNRQDGRQSSISSNPPVYTDNIFKQHFLLNSCKQQFVLTIPAVNKAKHTLTLP